MPRLRQSFSHSNAFATWLAGMGRNGFLFSESEFGMAQNPGNFGIFGIRNSKFLFDKIKNLMT